MKTKIQPKITLVGAGPGDPDLITVKGLKAIQSADVILYDALANPVLLEEAPKTARKIFVGKRAGNHKLKQEEINLLLVQSAFLYGHAVRLKGGDSFVFGRGHEELEFARAFDIPLNVIPGISSCIAAPELQEVPLTRRGVNESFWVITATTSSGELANDLQLAAQSSATVVILMGLGKLTEITQLFKSHGKSDTPVMVVQNSSLNKEQFALGTISTIQKEVKNKKIKTPAVIVIGEVVSLHPELLEVVKLSRSQVIKGSGNR
jgi:uroporphyrin-III C-methyltransferase